MQTQMIEAVTKYYDESIREMDTRLANSAKMTDEMYMYLVMFEQPVA